MRTPEINKGKLVIDGKPIEAKLPKSKETELLIKPKEDTPEEIRIKVAKAKQRHPVSTPEGITSGSYMDEGQKKTVAVETAESTENRRVDEEFQKKNNIP